VKILAGDLWVTMLQRMRRLEAVSPPRDPSVSVEVKSALFDARQRLLKLETLAHQAGLLPDVPDQMDVEQRPPVPLEMTLGQGLVDDINQQKQKFPGRLWESGTIDGVAYTQEFLKHLAASGDPRLASAAAASSLGLAERFEPSLDDIEMALAQWGPGHAGLAHPERFRHEHDNERAGEWLRYLIIATCFSILAVTVAAAL
jgi:hypothetical protein